MHISRHTIATLYYSRPFKIIHQPCFRNINIQNNLLWTSSYRPDCSCCLSQFGPGRGDSTIYDCVTAKLTFQEVILSVISSSSPRLQDHECACGAAPHFTTTLASRHLRDIRPGVSPRSLSWFIVALTDKRAVRLSVRGVIMAVGLAADGIAVIVYSDTQSEREREKKGENRDSLSAKLTRGEEEESWQTKGCLRWQRRTTEFQ